MTIFGFKQEVIDNISYIKSKINFEIFIELVNL